MENKTKDETIQKLIAIVKERKEEISRTEKAKWLTNCSLPFEGSRTNIQVVNDVNTLIRMAGYLIELNKTLESGSQFLLGGTSDDEIEIPELGGYNINWWLKDIKTRYEKIQLSTKKKELEEYEIRLDKLVSPEVREALELEEIKKGLGL